MVGEGHAFDMIRRIKEGREASRLRRERANDKLKHLNRANEPYPLPNTTPEEMERIIHDSEKKKEKEELCVLRVLCGELIIIYLINTAQSMTAIAIRTPMIISVPQTK